MYTGLRLKSDFYQEKVNRVERLTAAHVSKCIAAKLSNSLAFIFTYFKRKSISEKLVTLQKTE